MTLREAVYGAAISRPLSILHRALMRGSAAIFMMHRFADPSRGTDGHSTETLRRFLSWARNRKIPFRSLHDLVSNIQQDRDLRGGICFTVDDGYADFATVGMDVFAEFDCPVTVFLPTAFVDGDRWMWWDKVTYIVERTDATECPLPSIESGTVREGRLHSLDAADDRRRFAAFLETRMKGISESRLASVLRWLEDTLEVEIPGIPPDSRYKAMTWEQVRRCEKRGASFAPHTRKHIWLSSASRKEAREEISTSWERLREQTDRAVPVFCYPFGTADSFGERERELVRDCGLDAAVSAIPGYVSTGRSKRGRESVFSLPRFGYSADLLDRRLIATGMLKVRELF